MTNEQRIQQIQGAIEMIQEAQALVDEAVEGTGIEMNYTSYGRFGFDTLQGNGNPYDSSLHTLIEELGEDEE